MDRWYVEYLPGRDLIKLNVVLCKVLGHSRNRMSFDHTWDLGWFESRCVFDLVQQICELDLFEEIKNLLQIHSQWVENEAESKCSQVDRFTLKVNWKESRGVKWIWWNFFEFLRRRSSYLPTSSPLSCSFFLQSFGQLFASKFDFDWTKLQISLTKSSQLMLKIFHLFAIQIPQLMQISSPSIKLMQM